MRLLGASFKKTDEKPTANTYATELKRLDSGAERTNGQLMHGFHMIGFRRKGALFVLYPEGMTKDLAASRFEKMASTTPEKAAETIINGILKDKERLLVGLDAYALDVLTRVFPQGFSNFIGRVMLYNPKARKAG